MSPPPKSPRIYHITHVNNLASILDDGCIWSDAERIRRAPDARVVGMNDIKQRRLESLSVTCHPGTFVGEFVPFYFCPRSIMLFVIHCANHPKLEYRGGQRPILHLEIDLHDAIKWARKTNTRWAFTVSNAGACSTLHHSDPAQLNKIDWAAVAATDFSSRRVSEGKQAEFLIYEQVPFELVRRIGVIDNKTLRRVQAELTGHAHQPLVQRLPEWYY